jgi:chaperonin GroES
VVRSHLRRGKDRVARAVGPGRREDGKVIPLDVKAGNHVLFGKYAGSEIEIDGEEHLILREEDILGVVE